MSESNPNLTTKEIIQELLTRVMKPEKNASHVQSLPLPQLGTWPACVHCIDKPTVLAIVAAVTANRPLLILGEPGTGKSHTARAAAELLHRQFLSTVVQPHSDYQDLMWTIDHTARLGEAQLMAALKDCSPKQDARKELAIEKYLSPGPLWWAYDWQDAKGQKCHAEYRPEEDTNKSNAAKEQGVVLLIDEIDKADLSLANGLLETLGNGSFNVPFFGRSVRGKIPPLVVITSNDTRELPKAFIRRCVVHTLSLPEEETKLRDYFEHIGRAQFSTMEPSVIASAVAEIIKERKKSLPGQQVRTGLAELVDLLRALNELGDARQQENACESLAPYFLKQQRHG